MPFVIPPSCESLMAMQVVQYKDDPLAPWTMARAEWELYSKWLPELPPNVLDLGCGLGRTTAFLHHWYQAQIIHYHLADSNLISGSDFTGGWQPGQQEWCSDLSLTRAFLTANWLRDDQLYWHDLTRPHDCLKDVPPVRLVISTLAVGFHWPIEPWLPRLAPLCHEKTRLIFGVRHGKYNTDSKFDGFEVTGFVESGWKQDFLALAAEK